MKKNKLLILISLFIALVFIVSYFIFFNIPATETTKGTKTKQSSINKNAIIGNWIRTDAPYQIRLSDLQDNGIIKAEYFNPRPINVSKSEWMNVEGFLQVYIELRDENYPGSNYNLTYISERDMLVGDYFQAVEGFTYYVEFFRSE